MGNGIGRTSGGRRGDMFPPPLMEPDMIPPPLLEERDEELAFLTTFQRQYGTNHPFFYTCRLADALSIADEERKFLFMYIHSPHHPFSSSFCKDTLCSEPVVQFLDENFVSWGALFDRGQGLQMGSILKPATFPCCAVIAPAAADNMNVLQQMEGPMSPQQLLEMLHTTVDEHGLAFGHVRAKEEKERKRWKARAKEEEKIRADRLLKDEQDAAYHAALKIDQDKGKSKNHKPEHKWGQRPASDHSKNNRHFGRPFVPSTTVIREGHKSKEETAASRSKDAQVTQILIRFPNGERREQKFSSSDKVQSVFRYINSLSLIGGMGNYRLVSSFPRRVYGLDQSGMSLKDAGLHPKATLFLEPL
ncbi:Plant UBX domain-containing protein 10 [Linum perenne]